MKVRELEAVDLCDVIDRVPTTGSTRKARILLDSLLREWPNADLFDASLVKGVGKRTLEMMLAGALERGTDQDKVGGR